MEFKFIEEGKKVIKPCHSRELYNILKRANKNKRTFILVKWVNSYRYVNQDLSYLAVFDKMMNTESYIDEVFRMFKDYDNMIYFVIDILKDWNINQPHFKRKIYFEWNDRFLYKKFNGDKVLVNKYKKSIVASFVSKRKSKEIESEILNVIKNNPEFTLRDLTEKLNFDPKTIRKIIKQNNIKLNKITISDKKIIDLVDSFLNHKLYTEDSKFDLNVFLETLDIKLITLYRFYKKYPEYKTIIQKHSYM